MGLPDAGKWYDILCFVIVGVAALGALFVAVAASGKSCRHRLRRRQGDCGGGGDYVSLAAAAAALPAGGGGGVAPLGGVERLWRSCWRGLHPGWLLGLRVACLAAMAAVLAWDVRKYDPLIFVYYTEWTFSLVIVYFALGTLMSAYGCWTSSKQTTSIIEERYKFLKRDPDVEGIPSAATSSLSNGATKLQSYQELDEDQQKAGFWGHTMQIVYQTSGGAVILTDVVFWGLIVPFLSNEHFKLNLLMGCMHSLNLLFLLFDTALNSLPFPWFGMAYFVLWSCTYVIFQWVLHACGFTWWPYPFLKLDTPWAPLWYVCMALVHIPCYAFYTLVVKAKNSLFSKWFPNTYVRSH